MKEKNKQPLVSVFFPTFNHKRFIKSSLESVLKQTYENIEIIIGDDGSTDGQQRILYEYKKRYPEKIKLFINKYNMGISNNFNNILKNCNGKYISFFSGDDLMEPDKIATQVEYLEEHNECTICYHDVEMFNWENKSIINVKKHKQMGINGTVRELIKYGMFPDARTIMIRKSKIPEKGFDKRIPIANDWLFLVETIINGGEIHYIDKCLAYYGKHNNNISKKTYKAYLLNVLDHLNSCNIILVEHSEYSKEALFRYKKIIHSLRKYRNFDYKTMTIGLLDLKALIKYFIYKISLYSIKK